MFIDETTLEVRAGDGGKGAMSFHRERNMPHGGPDGGDGGHGGSVVLVPSSSLKTLIDLHYRKHYQAKRGEHGEGNNRYGASGADLELKVPVGTMVFDAETNERLADLSRLGQRCVVARGGVGGRGNAKFATAHHKAPRFAEKGQPGQNRRVRLELKLLADVGLVGFPNVGKSTLISRVSAARPRIADYPFTTLVPNLGTVNMGEGFSFVMADIPGLIEGAHRGSGLGHRFLKHVERTRLLVHILDMAASEERDPVQDYHQLNRELSLFSEKLARLPQLVVANKMDLPPASENLDRCREELEPALSRHAGEGTDRIFPISAVTGEGLQPLLHAMVQILQSPGSEPEEEAPVSRVTVESDPIHVTRGVEAGQFEVRSKRVEKLVVMTDLDNIEAVGRLQRQLDRLGVTQLLRDRGAKAGDTVWVGKDRFIFID